VDRAGGSCPKPGILAGSLWQDERLFCLRPPPGFAKPVIASRTGILPELIEDGKTGILVEDRTADLVRGMLTMAREQDFRQQCSHAARQYALNILSPEKYVKKVAGCYESLWDTMG
jgi:glycosyltransferase involved in cell wall biosynthesis